MNFIVSLAFIAIISSLGLAMYYMLKGGQSEQNKAHNMSKALALRVGLSIALFLCILISWQMGWIEPTGIKAGQ
jgi:hypothetical protein